jgi:hypothetical protein
MSQPVDFTIVQTPAMGVKIATFPLESHSMYMRPPYQFPQGTKFRIKVSPPFTDANGMPVTPDKVKLGFQVNDDPATLTTFTYTQGTGDPTNTIIKPTFTGTLTKNSNLITNVSDISGGVTGAIITCGQSGFVSGSVVTSCNYNPNTIELSQVYLGTTINSVSFGTVGVYYADIDTSLYTAGSWNVSVACTNVTGGADASKTKTRQNFSLTVLNNPFVL